jgi:hypothetical protein
MKAALALLVSIALGSACSGDNSSCERYAHLEWECGEFPPSEREMTLRLAEAMCEVAKKETDNELAALFRRELECAKTAKDCTAYEACQKRSARSQK